MGRWVSELDELVVGRGGERSGHDWVVWWGFWEEDLWAFLSLYAWRLRVI